jgi:hypothetical protein
VKKHRKEVDRERKKREKKETYLKSEPRIVFFKGFICDNSSYKDEEKRPRNRKYRASEVGNKKGTQESSEEKLEYVNKPKMCLRRSGASLDSIFGNVNKNDAYGNNGEVSAYDDSFPKKINLRKDDRVKREADNE